MTTSSETVWLPSGDESIAPVTILDANGRVVRVVSAEEFRRRRLAGGAQGSTTEFRRREEELKERYLSV